MDAMDLWSQMMLPLMSIRLPASGDVSMNYNPWTNWGFSSSRAGNPKIEKDIFENVALPGKQLGRLNRAVTTLIALAEQTQPTLDEEQAVAIREFKELAESIAQRRDEAKETIEGNAKRALRCFKLDDREAFDRLIDREMDERENGC